MRLLGIQKEEGLYKQGDKNAYKGGYLDPNNLMKDGKGKFQLLDLSSPGARWKYFENTLKETVA